MFKLKKNQPTEHTDDFKVIFDNAIDGIIIVDAQTKKFFLANKAMCEMLGYTLEKIKTLRVPDIHPSKDLPFVLEQFEKQVRKEMPLAKNLPVKRSDGSVFFADISATQIILKGRPYLAGFFRDVTERKLAEKTLEQSELRYKTIWDSSSDAIMNIEPPDWNFTSGNPATIKMFKAKDEADFISHKPWELSPEHQPDGSSSMKKAKEMIEIAVRDGSNFFEWTHRRLNGENFPAAVLLTRISFSGKIFCHATVRDITEQKTKITELEKVNKLMIGRELKMIELKEKIKELENKIHPVK